MQPCLNKIISKAIMVSKKRYLKLFENSKGENSNATKNVSIEEQLDEFKSNVRKRNITNINKVFAVVLLKKINE